MKRAEKFLTRHRHVAATLIGGLAIFSSTVGLGVEPGVGVAFGGLIWFAMLLILTPFKRRPGFEDLIADGDEADRVSGEVEEARRKIAALRKHADTFEAVALRRSLLSIAGSADAIIEDLNRNPRDYAKARKALTHYLNHAEQVTEKFVYMNQLGHVDHQLAERTAGVMADLEGVFHEYTLRMVDDDAMDLDARLAMLADAIETENLRADARKAKP